MESRPDEFSIIRQQGHRSSTKFRQFWSLVWNLILIDCTKRKSFWILSAIWIWEFHIYHWSEFRHVPVKSFLIKKIFTCANSTWADYHFFARVDCFDIFRKIQQLPNIEFIHNGRIYSQVRLETWNRISWNYRTYVPGHDTKHRAYQQSVMSSGRFWIEYLGATIIQIIICSNDIGILLVITWMKAGKAIAAIV